MVTECIKMFTVSYRSTFQHTVIFQILELVRQYNTLSTSVYVILHNTAILMYIILWQIC